MLRVHFVTDFLDFAGREKRLLAHKAMALCASNSFQKPILLKTSWKQTFSAENLSTKWFPWQYLVA